MFQCEEKEQNDTRSEINEQVSHGMILANTITQSFI
jgi:hypothetical protein